VRRSIAGHAPQLPKEIHRLVFSIAERLGRNVAGDDLFLVAILELPPGSPAKAALEVEGVDAGKALEEVRTTGDLDSDSFEGLVFPPAFNAVLGRAQAFAATLGDGTITPEHVLLALLWDPSNLASQLVWRLGVPRERVVASLASMSVTVPTTPIPAQHEIEVGERVWFDRSRVRDVIGLLGRRIDPGTHWSFNYEGERAWAVAEDHVDLEALVAEALATSE
jgi:hypothetical protein